MPPANQQEANKKPETAAKEEPRAVKKRTPQQAAADKPATRNESVYFGIPGTDPLTKIDRTVPADEPPALAPNDQLKYIGKRVPRHDGRFKTTGAAKYPSDMQLPNMLHGRFLSSSVAHARVTSVDTSKAEKYPGVKAVHVIENDLLSAQVLDKTKEVASKYPVIRYAGQPIAAVAATTAQAAQEAIKLITVKYEELPFVLDADEARKADAPKVFPAPAAQAETEGGGGGGSKVPQTGNVRGPERRTNGDVAKGFAASDVTVEGDYRTQVQTHSALETHGVVADWKPDMLTVHASTQSTSSVRDELAAIFKLPKSKVRVLTEYMGGGFGAKFGAGNVGVVAVQLSRKAGAPVRLFSDRKEEHWTGGNRPDAQQHIKIGATKDGKLQAIEFTSHGTAGVGTGAGTAGPAGAMYKCPNLKTEEYDVFTNASPGTAFRAPGHPQGCFAVEQAMDELAEKLGMDPLALRDLNDESPARRAERRVGAEKFGWKEKFRKPNSNADGPIKRGVGFAQSVWYRIVNMDSGVEVRINRDGSVEALSAVQDIGGGIKTVIAQVVAEELGIEPRNVQVTIGDTVSPPGPPSGGSMTTTSITPPARNAAYKAKQELLAHVKPALKGTDPASLSLKQLAAKLPIEMVSATARRSPEYGKREGMFLGGVQFAEVAVDTETGIVKVERVLAVHDCGRPMNMLQLESQVNGGILQGISYALYENRRLDRNTGIMVNPNLEQYKILGAKETPKIDVHLIEHYIARSSTDAGGIGEPATIPTAAAIANAFYNATGARVRELPITPARVLAALGTLRQGATA